jgi:co-chaperonin GroES (HSP10)
VLKPIRNNVIVELIEKKLETDSGIILKSTDPAEVNRALVLSAGPDVEDIKVGDTILPNWNKARKTIYEREDYYVVCEDDVVLVFEE